MNHRKTVNAKTLVNNANLMLASGISRERQEAICIFLETCLIEANAYKGYRFVKETPMGGISDGSMNPDFWLREYYV